MAIRYYVAKRNCTFRNRQGGPARLFVKGDELSVSDDKIVVPEDKFEPLTSAAEKAEARRLSKADLQEALDGLGIEYPKSAKVKALRALYDRAVGQDDDDMLD